MDRNLSALPGKAVTTRSLSARRAWIEIGVPTTQADKHAVALRKESVDRNTLSKNPMISIDKSRSPQGERG